jgi:hypothetical protein
MDCVGGWGSYVEMNVSKRNLSTKYGLTSGITASIHKPQRVNLYLLRSTNSVPGQLTVFSKENKHLHRSFHVRCARLQGVIL